jgi:flavin-binding protein dodecin
MEPPWEPGMSEHTYRVIEIVGSSATSIDDAINNAVRRAGATMRHLDWFEVTEMRGQIEGDKVAYHQVTLKVGFRLEGA